MKGLALLKENPAGCTTLVVGSGKSGVAAMQFLHSLGSKIMLSEKGSRENLDADLVQWLEDNEVIYETGGHSEKHFLNADLIVVSPGVPLEMAELAAARQAGIEIIGELGLAAAYLDIPVVAVTGTNGKTTVTEMIGTMLAASGKRVFVGGNIGTPLTEYLLGEQDAEVAVIEVSSYQLDTAGDFRPQVAVLLNISPDHLDRYVSFDAYADSKMRIFASQKPQAAAVCNFEDPEITKRLDESTTAAKRFFFGRSLASIAGAVLREEKIAVSGIGEIEECFQIPEHMQHSPHCENAMAAVLAARLMHCPPEAIERGLAAFERPPHRLARVAEINGVTYFDDSKATNIGALLSALSGMEQPVILIAGGRDKGGDYRLLAESIRRKVKKMILIGEAKNLMAQALAGETVVEMADSLEEAVKKAADTAEAGDVVLLSPACASFDMFASYAERGEKFQQAVKKKQVQAKAVSSTSPKEAQSEISENVLVA